MEGNKTKPRAILVFGAPCSGKTTFAARFATKFSLAFYDLDELKEEHKFTRKNIILILGLITRTKQTIIIEGGLDTERERSEIRSLLYNAGYDPSLVWIQTDASTIRNRLKNKYHSLAKAKEAYNLAIDRIEAPSDAESPIILSGKHTFETQAKHVISGLADLSANDRKR
ncbi:AAA family ATPase [Candidatus Saccharibacteria bacterium]|nr:AAA family ATPase [Candidatus Saccharibacteria bacterium]